VASAIAAATHDAPRQQNREEFSSGQVQQGIGCHRAPLRASRPVAVKKRSASAVSGPRDVAETRIRE